jgi:chromosome segregation ATPase
MTELKERSIEQYDTEIATCHREIVQHDQQLAEIRGTLAQLARHPDIRAQSLQELEQQLSSTRNGLEIALEQAAMYKGTDIEEATARDAIQSVDRRKQLEKQIEETRKKNQEHDAADETKQRELQQQEQLILRKRDSLQNICARAEQERNKRHTDQGKKVYQACMSGYQELKRKASTQQQDLEQTYQEIESSHSAILNQLEPYPDLQRLFMSEHNVEPTDGPLRVTEAAITYLERLIADHLSLEQAAMNDGKPLCEILALTDQEILAQYQGGLYNLQEKRSQLLDWAEQHKAQLVPEPES